MSEQGTRVWVVGPAVPHVEELETAFAEVRCVPPRETPGAAGRAGVDVILLVSGGERSADLLRVRELRRSAEETGLVLSTPERDPGAVLEALGAGADECVPLGDGAPAVVAALRRALARRRGSAVGRAAPAGADLARFASIVSHDLREPLRTVVQYSNMLRLHLEQQRDPSVVQYAHRIREAADSMNALLRALVRYARTGLRQLELQPVDCDAVVRRALENLKVAVEESGAVITTDPLPTVLADGVLLLQVFQNLLSNALKFTDAAEPRVHVSAERREGEWLLSVRDRGIGIPAQHAREVFELFRRVHAREGDEGTGIGLAICQRIVERHGGRIWVESEPREGSTFFFAIPVPSEP